MSAALPRERKIAYAAPAFALAVVGIPVYVYIPKFYTDVVGVPVAAAGAILAGVRLLDAATDPLMGHLSDRSRTPFGRRRPYIALGAPLVAAAMFFLCTPPQGVQASWFAFWITALFLAWTAVTVPYEALGPELTFDYRERNGLFALRDGMLLAGTLAASASPVLIEAVLAPPAGPEGERAKFFWMAVLYAPLLVGTAALCAYAVRELPLAAAAPAASGLGRGLLLSLKNRPFRILLASYTVSAFGANLPATLILYYVEYVLEASGAEVFLLLYLGSGILFLPAWAGLAGRIGKKAAWLSSIAVNTGAFAGVFFLGPGDAGIYGVLVFLSGVGLGATLALPSSIQADVIDYDELLTGERREGRYVGLWSIAKKLAAAGGVGAGLFLLGRAGYVPNAPQPESAILALRVLYALVPSLCNLAALAIAVRFPIDAGRHARIREAIARRARGETVEDPLRPGVWLPPAKGQ
ncbi:MAG: MFS transporter [Desulfobacterales bacterium]